MFPINPRKVIKFYSTANLKKWCISNSREEMGISKPFISVVNY